METLSDVLGNATIIQCLFTASAFIFFYRMVSKKLDRLEAKIDAVEIRLNKRIDNLAEKVEDIDRRLCRIEGSLTTHGHCLFSQSRNDQKAI
jgi:tetrahydromethanopterin S-methyltransferase subunit G